MPEIVDRFFFKEHVGETIFSTQADSGMVDSSIGIDQFSPDNSGAGEGEPSGHVFEPTRSQCFDIVIEMEQEWSVGLSATEIYETRVVEPFGIRAGAEQVNAIFGRDDDGDRIFAQDIRTPL